MKDFKNFEKTFINKIDKLIKINMIIFYSQKFN